MRHYFLLALAATQLTGAQPVADARSVLEPRASLCSTGGGTVDGYDYKYYCNTYAPGSGITTIYSFNTFRQCVLECSENDLCKVALWFAPNKVCTLKKNKGKLDMSSSSKGFQVGVKQF